MVVFVAPMMSKKALFFCLHFDVYLACFIMLLSSGSFNGCPKLLGWPEVMFRVWKSSFSFYLTSLSIASESIECFCFVSLVIFVYCRMI